MSAIGIGTSLAQPGASSDSDGGPLARIIKWVPGEVIATFVAVLGALQAATAPAHHWNGSEVELWVAFAALAFALTVIGATQKWRQGDPDNAEPMDHVVRLEIGVRAVLAAGGFALWSAAVPGSWLATTAAAQAWGAAAPLMVLLLATLYSALAELLVMPYAFAGLKKALREHQARAEAQRTAKPDWSVGSSSDTPTSST